MGDGTVGRVEEEVRRIAGEEGIEIDKLIVFGSRARGDYQESSDVDILLVSEDFEGVNWYKRPKNFFLDWDYDNLPTPEILCYTPAEFKEKKTKKGSIVKTAHEEGVSLA